MARQYVIPFFGVLNETTTSQFVVPATIGTADMEGSVIVNATSSTALSAAQITVRAMRTTTYLRR